MSERQPPLTGPGAYHEDQEPPFDFALLEIEMSAEADKNAPLVEKLNKFRRDAIELDERQTAGNTDALLTKRYRIIKPEGTESYPFRHERIILEPKVGNLFPQIEGIAVRFPHIDSPDKLINVTDMAVMTLGLQSGLDDRYFISMHEFGNYDNNDGLLIRDNVLLGMNTDYVNDGGLMRRQLLEILAFYEPGLQLKTDE